LSREFQLLSCVLKVVSSFRDGLFDGTQLSDSVDNRLPSLSDLIINGIRESCDARGIKNALEGRN